MTNLLKRLAATKESLIDNMNKLLKQEEELGLLIANIKDQRQETADVLQSITKVMEEIKRGKNE